MIKKKSFKYDLAPQSKLYDVMLAKWRPFLMFNQDSNLRSKVCNTDIYGLRFNKLKNKKNSTSIFDNINKEKKTGILLGNSTAFGEGASKDEMTISSLLSNISNYHVFNLCGRGFSGMQEIINYLLLSHKIKKVKKIFVISGLQDSILPFYTPQKEFDSFLTPIYGHRLFNFYMQKAVIGWKKKLLQFFLKLFFIKNINVNAINRLNLFEQIAIKKEFVNVSNKNPYKIYEEIIARNFFLLSSISKSLNIKVNYILQPVATWCMKKKSHEEKKILNEESSTPHLKKIYSHVDRKKYLFVKKIILKEIRKYNMGFLDLNEFLGQKKYDNEWLFVGNFHVNDNCNNIIAKEIYKKFIKKKK
ncbi:hypothetical protein OAN91_00245 [Pelagibacteraceae bacterium]|jgi:hypothetical protein|nr:hypothetical protein [Pelagibacteraceae bacterium]